MPPVRSLVLASRSPRRVALLQQIGLAPKIIPSTVEETFDRNVTPAENAMRLAYEKAADVGCTLQDAIIIGADTIVVLDDVPLSKPIDRSDAVRMLEMLSGRTHTVVTGFALLERPGNRLFTDHEETRVTFRPLPREEIEAYVASGSPMDKAGAYGIQDDYGAVFVSRIEGCYYNVVGFPLAKFYLTMQKFQQQLGLV